MHNKQVGSNVCEINWSFKSSFKTKLYKMTKLK